MTLNQDFSTKAIHDGKTPSLRNYSLPNMISITFPESTPNQDRGFRFAPDNEVREKLQTCLPALEDAKHSICFSSGLDAVNGITTLLKSGDHLVAGDDLYGGTNHYFQQYLSQQNITSTFVDTTNIQNLTAAIRPNTKMLWFETPTNPLLKITDIKAVADSLKSRPDIIIVVDNTFLTSYFQKPLELGAHITMYSLAKYMSGHADVIMGAAITNREDLAERLRFVQNAMGSIPSLLDCALINRSLKTLELRLQQHMKNSLAVAKFLESHPCVERVLHPYLPSHPQYELALKQSTGHSGMVSFYIKGDPKKFFKALKLFTWTRSIGDLESLTELPCIMTQAVVSEDMCKSLGITDRLIRLSIGLEAEKDLLADLKQALDASQ